MMQKPRTHEIETLSDAYLTKTLSKWICNKFTNDYAIDYRVEITSSTKITGKQFYVQNKGTDEIKITKNYVTYPMETKYLKLYLLSSIPVYLIRYDAQNDCAYWQNLQKAIILDIQKTNPSWDKQHTVTIKIPIDQRLKNIDVLERDVIETTNFLLRIMTNKLLGLEGFEPFLNDILEFEKSVNMYRSNLELQKLHLSELYFKDNNLESSKTNLNDIINSSTSSLHKLIAITGALSLCSFIIDDNQIINLSEKGISAAKELNDSSFLTHFECYKLLLLYKNLNLEFIPVVSSNLIKKDKNPYNIEFQTYQNILKSVVKQNIDEIYNKISEKLKILKSASYYELYFIILLKLINLGALFNYGLIMIVEDKSIIIKEMNQKTEYFDSIIEILKKLSNQDLLLYAYIQIGGYFEICDQEKGLRLYKEGLNLAKEKNHQFYISKFNYLISNSSQFVASFEKKHEFQMEFQLFINKIKSEAYKILEKDPSFSYRNDLEQAIQDLDPSQYMQGCKNLQICYNPSLFGMTLHNYAFGEKSIGCQYVDLIFTSNNLVEIYKTFSKKHCETCLHKSPRSKEWSCSIAEMKKMHNFFIELRNKRLNN